MTLEELNISEDEFDIFITFNALEKIEFLSNAMEFGIEVAMLNQIGKMPENIEEHEPISITSSQDFLSGNYRLCVTTLEGEIQLNSDSLKTMRDFVLKLYSDGLLLVLMDKKKSRMDMYRYFKAYKVLGRCTPISLS